MTSFAENPPGEHRQRGERISEPGTGLGRLQRDLLAEPTPVPLYYRLAQAIRDLIDDGSLRPGDKLPAEQHVADYFYISRPTVRQAWQELEDQGRLVRDHGRGTFVRDASD